MHYMQMHYLPFLISQENSAGIRKTWVASTKSHHSLLAMSPATDQGQWQSLDSIGLTCGCLFGCPVHSYSMETNPVFFEEIINQNKLYFKLFFNYFWIKPGSELRIKKQAGRSPHILFYFVFTVAVPSKAVLKGVYASDLFQIPRRPFPTSRFWLEQRRKYESFQFKTGHTKD